VVYWHFSPDRLEVILSTNGGNTFNSPRLIANVATYDAPRIRDGILFLRLRATEGWGTCLSFTRAFI